MSKWYAPSLRALLVSSPLTIAVLAGVAAAQVEPALAPSRPGIAAEASSDDGESIDAASPGVREHGADVRAKAATDSIYHAHAPGNYEFRRFSYRSSVGDLDIPAYLFQPLDISLSDRLPALIWVHGGVHGDWGPTYLPFVEEAVRRGYVVIAPDYRGSTGYGIDYYETIDYGGYEVDDVISVVDYLRTSLPHVDPERIGIMGWSHGGLITALAVFRDDHPFRAAVAVAPVTNLVFRLSYKGPAYQALFTRQRRIGALPHERPHLYIERSPVYQVDGLRIPLMVQVATNDPDVDFVESEMLLHALQVKKPELAELYVYEDAPGGHFFSRLVDRQFRPIDTPVMRDSWARTWSFFERHLGGTVRATN